jgi:hypothetical protein
MKGCPIKGLIRTELMFLNIRERPQYNNYVSPNGKHQTTQTHIVQPGGQRKRTVQHDLRSSARMRVHPKADEGRDVMLHLWRLEKDAAASCLVLLFPLLYSALEREREEGRKGKVTFFACFRFQVAVPLR